MDVQKGISLVERRDPQFAQELSRWFTGAVRLTFEGWTLKIDTAVTDTAVAMPLLPTRDLEDVLIEATARVRDFTVVTRATSHLEDLGVRILDPWRG